MVSNALAYQIPDYRPDTNDESFFVKGLTYYPNDVDANDVIAVIESMTDVRVYSRDGVEIGTDIKIDGPEDRGIRPRMLRVHRSNGNTMSMTIRTDNNYTTVANQLIQLFDGTDAPVVCVEIIGEKIAYDVTALATPGDEITPVDDKFNRLMYAGTFDYFRDNETTSARFPFKMASTGLGVFPSAIAGLDQWLLNPTVSAAVSIPCGRNARQPIKTRRFEVGTLYVDNDTGGTKLQTTRVPVSRLQDVVTFKDAAIALNNVACLTYHGEHNQRFEPV